MINTEPNSPKASSKDMGSDEQRQLEKQSEKERGEPTIQELIAICKEALGDEVEADFEGMDLPEAIGYAYTLLLESGENPDELLAEKGFLEAE
ncbi:hypothetical protein COT77_01765 [Candidatus Berkelbacteria bacterium CG10_big_fil_rev_8_21_14_0_10_41_12]|uniref:Uncharacterized protein n=1 Tax=Candidatus Berkelbacteria bacterium CG10_big_fil_rev_8_21_14_0_10_41_12 TaxID=1974513 RepID=A0A2M6WX71_9BACT|nr:MAG: hypothetical protein COT77_01765 [Candidatus Berkelbacteria bacterium CG10_big_fil_rev_8_21_14_0_10_41_12]